MCSRWWDVERLEHGCTDPIGFEDMKEEMQYRPSSQLQTFFPAVLGKAWIA
jgi:hypothetical protein